MHFGYFGDFDFLRCFVMNLKLKNANRSSLKSAVATWRYIASVLGYHLNVDYVRLLVFLSWFSLAALARRHFCTSSACSMAPPKPPREPRTDAPDILLPETREEFESRGMGMV